MATKGEKETDDVKSSNSGEKIGVNFFTILPLFALVCLKFYHYY